MSLLISTKKQQKKNKTTDISQYQKDYRENNAEHLRNLDKVNYYKKKYNLEKDFLGLFGEYSGDVYKIIRDFNELTKKCPELAPHVISHFTIKIPNIDE